jgi:hypothetical protein
MIDPAVGDVQDLNYFADWVELCTTLDPDGVISQTDVARAAQASGLITGDPNDVFNADESYRETSDFADDDPQRNFAEQVWEVLDARAFGLAQRYPFEVGRDSITRRSDLGTDTPSYMMSLILSQLIRYRSDMELPEINGYSFSSSFRQVAGVSD